MNETTNLKLKKPAGNEYISVGIINGNMDIIDTGMKEISDSVDAPEFDASGTVEGITGKTTLLASFVTRMPLVKFMRNVVAGFKLVLYAGQVVNNCVTDNAGLPLSAAQGKVLMDLYTVLNTKITSLGIIRIERGGHQFGAIKSNTYTDHDVVFQKPFDSTPSILVCDGSKSDSAKYGSMSVSPINVSKTGFTIRYYNDNADYTPTPYAAWVAFM